MWLNLYFYCKIALRLSQEYFTYANLEALLYVEEDCG